MPIWLVWIIGVLSSALFVLLVVFNGWTVVNYFRTHQHVSAIPFLGGIMTQLTGPQPGRFRLRANKPLSDLMNCRRIPLGVTYEDIAATKRQLLEDCGAIVDPKAEYRAHIMELAFSKRGVA